MRVHIRHEITRRFDPAARHAAANLRITPRSHEGQFIQRWVLDLDSECRLFPYEDAFGNLCHTFSLDGPVSEITVIAEGDIDTQETAGVLRGSVERFAPTLYLRATEMTEPNAGIISMAEEITGSTEDPLSRLHNLMDLLKARIAEVEPAKTGEPLTAAATLDKGAACSGGFAHLFAAVVRQMGLPARHISGYLALNDTGHTRHWAEVYVPSFGWVGFDAGRAECPTERYVRLAVGLDAPGVAPFRGTGGELSECVSALDARLAIKQAQSQTQN